MEKGDVYGRLTVIDVFKRGRRLYAKCMCECGSMATVRADGLKSGHAKSCGCYKRDVQRSLMTERNTTHGQSKTRLYNTYYGMLQRCHNPHFRFYSLYGGRGISVCSEWREDFMAFKKWADDNGYSAELTIDRIDVNGDYEPSNCRWVTHQEQMLNTRRNRILTHDGKSMCISEWAKETGIRRETITRRIDVLGWSVGDALTKEVVKA